MGGAVRLAYYYTNSKGIETLTDTLNKTFKYRTEKGVDEETMEWYVKFAKNITVFWFWDVFITGEFMALLPLIFIFKNGRVLPVPAWYPWDKTQSPFYEISYSLQLLTNVHMSFVYGNSDMLFVSYCILTGGQFKILGLNYKNTIYRALLRFGVSEEKVKDFSKKFNNYGVDEEIDDNLTEVTHQNSFKNKSLIKIEKKKEIEDELLAIIDTKKYQKVLLNVLNECIEQHQTLISYCDSIESFFSPIILPSLSFAMFYVIFMLFTVVTTTDADRSIFLFYVSYIICGLMQLFLLTYFGQTLTTQSQNAKDYLYEAPWYLGDEKFKSSFQFVQMRFGKPIKLTAGKFLFISLETYIGVCI